MADTTHDVPRNGPEHHLCVLVHGLWGNPHHLRYLATALRDTHPDPTLHILVAKRNSGNHTYDGIELGGERVTREIEDEIEALAAEGKTVTKLSLVGYSLGGLVARYAIGLLYSRGWFDKIEPVNFTTFASPWLGARTPRIGFLYKLFNVLGSRTLSMSGQQLFLTDSFRDTGRPLLVVLADPKSIFMRGLARFGRRTLYANAVNDRTAQYYTTAISRIDPFVDLRAVQVHYVKGYDDVILDPDHPVSALATRAELPKGWKRCVVDGQAVIGKAPTMVLLGLLLPVGLVAFLINSGIQSVRSSRRIQLHEQGKAGIGIGTYRIPLMIEDVERAVEGVVKDARPRRVSHTEQQLGDPARDPNERETIPRSSNLSTSSTIPAAVTPSSATPPSSPEEEEDEEIDDDEEALLSDGESAFPALALSEEQLEMIRSLDRLGFRKYPVHIHHDRHSHAAIIVRMSKKTFDEGRVVVRHWLENEFDI